MLTGPKSNRDWACSGTGLPPTPPLSTADADAEYSTSQNIALSCMIKFEVGVKHHNNHHKPNSSPSLY
ncbi:hypothetical protein SCA6_006858 [Theobroma cacao]